MDKKTIIDEKNYKEYLKAEVLEVGDNKKINLKEINKLIIIAGDCNDIKVGNDCNITCGAYCNIVVNDNNIVKTEFSCKIKGRNYNTIEATTSCKIKVWDENTLTFGNKNNLKFNGEGNNIKGGKFCKIKGTCECISSNLENTLEMESYSNLSLDGRNSVKISGECIKLEFLECGADNNVFNAAEDSVILTYEDSEKMRIYKTNKLIDGEIIPIINGKIGKEYKVKY